MEVCELDMDTEMPRKDKLTCGHYVCHDCLMNLEKLQCPFCRRPLAGPLVTNEVVIAIEERIQAARRRKELLDYLKTWLVQIDPLFDVNEHYNNDEQIVTKVEEAVRRMVPGVIIEEGDHPNDKLEVLQSIIELQLA
jgi:hypothetical protein